MKITEGPGPEKEVVEVGEPTVDTSKEPTSLEPQQEDDDVGLNVLVSPKTQLAVEGNTSTRSDERPGGKLLSMLTHYQPPEVSSSTERPESESDTDVPGGPPMPARDIRRVKVGRSIAELDNEVLLGGQHVKVAECSTQSVFQNSKKVTEITKERKYDLVYLRPASFDGPREAKSTNGTKLHSVTKSNKVGEVMSEEELSKALIGRVKRIVETTTEHIYQNGILALKRESKKEYEVDVLAGIEDQQ